MCRTFDIDLYKDVNIIVIDFISVFSLRILSNFNSILFRYIYNNIYSDIYNEDIYKDISLIRIYIIVINSLLITLARVIITIINISYFILFEALSSRINIKRIINSSYTIFYSVFI